MSTHDDSGFPRSTAGNSGSLPNRAGSFARDAFERFASTAVASAIAFATVEVQNLDAVWIPVGTALLTIVKTFIAKKIGRPDSASLDPAV